MARRSLWRIAAAEGCFVERTAAIARATGSSSPPSSWGWGLGGRYALAVNRGVTRAAYRIDYWRERVPTDRDYSEADNGKRLGFWGMEAPELSHLLNRSIRHLPQPAGNPVVYLNLSPTAAPLVPLHRGAAAYAKAEEEQAR